MSHVTPAYARLGDGSWGLSVPYRYENEVAVPIYDLTAPEATGEEVRARKLDGSWEWVMVGDFLRTVMVKRDGCQLFFRLYTIAMKPRAKE